MLFKDKPEINHKNTRELMQNLEVIAELIREAGGVCDKSPVLLDKLLNNAKMDRKHEPNHQFCEGCLGDSIQMTEKRMCRCMYYYNSPDKRKNSKCDSCKIDYRWKQTNTNIKIIEYEYPTEYVLDTVGGMDLVIVDGSQEYAVEVKPEKSKESIARMFAEILTYTLEYENGIRKPAICFFEDSDQMKQYNKLKEMGNEALEYIEKYVKVYYFKVDKQEGVYYFDILPIEEK